MKLISGGALLLALSHMLVSSSTAFTVPSSAFNHRQHVSTDTTATSTVQRMTQLQHHDANDDNMDDNNSQALFHTTDTRREFMTKSMAAVGSTITAATTGFGSGVLAPSPALAVKGADKVNASLKAYGLPPVTNVAKGMTPLLEVWGKGANRFPLLVLMNYPVTWVVTLPSNDVNGEDGTIQAGEYAKGDTATLYVYEDEGSVKNIASAEKSLFERALIKAISQKGSNVYQNFKVTKVVPQSGPEYGGKEYVVCDFKYELLTGAGFEVDRRGVAAITSEGPAVEVLWAASTRERFKKTEETLRDITSSFRVYADGLNFSDQLIKQESV